MNWFEEEPMKYFAAPANMNKRDFDAKLRSLVDSGEYIYAQKIDGNYSRAIITPSRNALQTRGISKKTGKYGEVQNKVLWWDNVLAAFSDETVLLGEIYLDNGRDADVGKVLRCLDEKALSRQNTESNTLKWYVFDILSYEGKSLMESPFEQRVKYIDLAVAKINSSYVTGAIYKPANDTLYEDLNTILSSGGEGIVLTRKDCIYEFGKRGPHSWDTVKIKASIGDDIDGFIIGFEPPEKFYNGKEIQSWQYWIDVKSGQKLYGDYFNAYSISDKSYQPISKNFYNDWCAAISVGVYDKDGTIYKLCDISGIEEEIKEAIKQNPQSFLMMPVKITGMEVSTNQNGTIGIRHPKLVSIRENDIDLKDCTLEKVLNQL